MKIIDLLNKIAKGEEVPKKFRYDDEVFVYRKNDYQYEHGNISFFRDYCSPIYDLEDCLSTFNKEVEIIEEEKEIKHINIQYWRDDEYTPEERINVCMTTINQLIDVINDMRDKE
jgi:hypothetical protein